MQGICSSTSSSYSVDSLTENLKKLFEFVNKNKGAYTDEVMNVTSSIAKDVLEQSKVKDNINKEQYGEIWKKLKDYTLRVSDEYLGDLKRLGGYSQIQRSNRGKLNFSRKNGIGIDTAYQELSELYPWAFDSEIINPADQLERMIEVANIPRVTYENPYIDADIDSAAIIYAQDIFDKYLELRANDSINAKQEDEIQKLKAEYDKKRKDIIKNIAENQVNRKKQPR